MYVVVDTKLVKFFEFTNLCGAVWLGFVGLFFFLGDAWAFVRGCVRDTSGNPAGW